MSANFAGFVIFAFGAVFAWYLLANEVPVIGRFVIRISRPICPHCENLAGIAIAILLAASVAAAFGIWRVQTPLFLKLLAVLTCICVPVPAFVVFFAISCPMFHICMDF
jgi:Sec-independent protein secretion pathway component TatC